MMLAIFVIYPEVFVWESSLLKDYAQATLVFLTVPRTHCDIPWTKALHFRKFPLPEKFSHDWLFHILWPQFKCHLLWNGLLYLISINNFHYPQSHPFHFLHGIDQDLLIADMMSWSPKKKIQLLDQGPGLITQELLCSRALLERKRTEKVSDTDIRRGTESAPLASLSKGAIYF